MENELNLTGHEDGHDSMLKTTSWSEQCRVKTMAFMKRLLHSPKAFPMEALMGIAFFLIAAWKTEKVSLCEALPDASSWADILYFFVPLMVLTFYMHRVNRWAYVVAGLLFVPLMMLNLYPFLWSAGFYFTYVLAAILLVIGTKQMNDQPFAIQALSTVIQFLFGLLITGLLSVAVLAIVASFLYIFGLDQPTHLFEHILQFIWFFIAPQVCFTLVSQVEEGEVSQPSRIIEIILNYILSPAIIIYTIILYAYFIRITIEWDLPKGGVAWMVMAFVATALVGRLMQYVLKRRNYEWFYDRFTWIAIPPLIMYWVGALYRIRLYSFTEDRVYLIVAGVLMTLFVVMLLWRGGRRFQLMALLLSCAIIVFTYIPGLSAKSIGLRCQKERMSQMISELGLTDPVTHKFREELDIQEINKDSVLTAQYREASSVINYVQEKMGHEAFQAEFGRWEWRPYQFGSDKPMNSRTIERPKSIELGEYGILLNTKDYSLDYLDGRVIISQDERIVMEYPIGKAVRENPQLLDRPSELMTCRNDSLLLVLHQVWTNDKEIAGVASYNNYDLFRKVE